MLDQRESRSFRTLATFMAVLMFAIAAAPALAQDPAGGQPGETTPAAAEGTTMSDVEECQKGDFDGTKDAKESPGHIILGLFCGIFGFLIAYISKPVPPADKLVGKSPEYVRCYTESYQERARKKNVQNACSGWLVGAALVMLIITLQDAQEASSH